MTISHKFSAEDRTRVFAWQASTLSVANGLYNNTVKTPNLRVFKERKATERKMHFVR